MSAINEKLLDDILTLPADKRTKLIEILIESLNVPIDKNIDEEWANEAEKRVKAIKSGKVKTLDGEQVLKKLRDRIKK